MLSISKEALLRALSAESDGGAEITPEESALIFSGSDETEPQVANAFITAVNSVESDGSRISDTELETLTDQYGISSELLSSLIDNCDLQIQARLFSPSALFGLRYPMNCQLEAYKKVPDSMLLSRSTFEVVRSNDELMLYPADDSVANRLAARTIYAALRARGYVPEFEIESIPVITYDDGASYENRIAILMKRYNFSSGLYDDGWTDWHDNPLPQSLISRAASNRFFMPHEIYSTKSISFSPFYFIIDYSDGKYFVYLVDWLKEEIPYTLEISEEVLTEDPHDPFCIQNIIDDIGAIVQQLVSSYDLPTVEQGIAVDEELFERTQRINPVWMFPISEPDIQSGWQAIADDFEKVLIAADRWGALDDYTPSAVSIDPSSFSGSQLLAVDGNIDSIVLMTRLDRIAPEWRPSWGELKIYEGRESEGYVAALRGRPPGSLYDDDVVLIQVAVDYPMDSEQIHRTISLDLTEIGLRNYGPLIVQRTMEPVEMVGTAQNIGLYTLMPDSSIVATPEQLAAIVTGIEDVEEAFGFEHGGLINGILVQDSDEENANSGIAFPDTVVFLDEYFRRNTAVIHLSGRHETYHGLDMQYGLSSSAYFAPFYKYLNEAGYYSDFFSILTERNAYQMEDGGGHPQDDELELFASLMNSLHLPDWRAWVGSLTPFQKGLYYHALSAAKRAIETSELALEHPSSLDRLETAIDEVAQTIPRIPYLEELVLSYRTYALAAPSLVYVTPETFDDVVISSEIPSVVLELKDQDMVSRYDFLTTMKTFQQAMGGAVQFVVYDNPDSYSQRILDMGGDGLNAVLSLIVDGNVEDQMEIGRYQDRERASREIRRVVGNRFELPEDAELPPEESVQFDPFRL